jgi:hypothetical protein
VVLKISLPIFKILISSSRVAISVADQHHFDADPDPDTACYFDADPNLDPDPTFHLDADPDPAYHFDADPDPGHVFQFDADQDTQHRYGM